VIERAAGGGVSDYSPGPQELRDVFNIKYGRDPNLGWGPRTRLAFGYFSPDDHYEATVASLVKDGCAWADVGCGRFIFPSNPDLARQLAARCSLVFGIDPDPNVRENPFVTERFEGMVEDCATLHRFDLITLRMVAEHITDPERSVRKLAELTKPGGMVVVYTPNKWSPIPVLTALVPNPMHHSIKRFLWDTEVRDVFPTAFKLNTRKALADHFGKCGMQEQYFTYLDDCRTFDGYRVFNFMELSAQRLLRGVGLRYPENCLLGIYRKNG
jgi:SAM-dependent methyltransferase